MFFPNFHILEIQNQFAEFNVNYCDSKCIPTNRASRTEKFCRFIGRSTRKLWLPAVLIGGAYLGVEYLRNKQPPNSNVVSILGSDPSDDGSKEGGAAAAFTLNTVAHRGMGLDAPENTISAFQYCLDRGFKMIELDLSVTKDGVPIIFHDDDLLRLTGEKLVISETNWEDLQKIDIAAKHPLRDRFPNARIPTLEETLDFCLKNNLKVILDLKANDSKLVKVVHEEFKKREMYDSVMVSGFNPFMIYAVRRGDPNIVCSMAIRRFDYPNAAPGDSDKSNQNFILKAFDKTVNYIWWQTHPWCASIIGLSSILLNREAVSPAAVKYWRARNIRLMSWTVNHPAEKLYYVKCLKTTYLTDTFIGETSAYNNNDPIMNTSMVDGKVINNSHERSTSKDKLENYDKITTTRS